MSEERTIPSTIYPPFDPPEEDRLRAWGISADNSIRAIETRWNGYRFRSRTEARWAVLLSELGIEFLYEMEGLILPGNIYYLPDFYLPHVRMWGEVKPFALTQDERRKCELLAEGTRRPCLHLVGIPDLKTYFASVHDCGITTDVEYLLDIYYHGRRLYDLEHRLFACPGHIEDYSDEYTAAVEKARGARFEREAA